MVRPGCRRTGTELKNSGQGRGDHRVDGQPARPGRPRTAGWGPSPPVARRSRRARLGPRRAVPSGSCARSASSWLAASAGSLAIRGEVAGQLGVRGRRRDTLAPQLEVEGLRPAGVVELGGEGQVGVARTRLLAWTWASPFDGRRVTATAGHPGGEVTAGSRGRSPVTSAMIGPSVSIWPLISVPTPAPASLSDARLTGTYGSAMSRCPARRPPASRLAVTDRAAVGRASSLWTVAGLAAIGHPDAGVVGPESSARASCEVRTRVGLNGGSGLGEAATRTGSRRAPPSGRPRRTRAGVGALLSA